MRTIIFCVNVEFALSTIFKNTESRKTPISVFKWVLKLRIVVMKSDSDNLRGIKAHDTECFIYLRRLKIEFHYQKHCTCGRQEEMKSLQVF